MAKSSTIYAEIEKFIVDRLRDEHPYLKIDAIYEAAKAGADLIREKVDDQSQAIEESKHRCSFFSLSPELRNRVYELVLIPQVDGEGGICNSRGILVCGIDHPGTCSSDWVQQPALTRVSKTIREESLPFFYSMNQFVLSFVAEAKEPSPDEFQYEFRLCGSEKWFQQIGVDKIPLIEHLDVCFWGHDILKLGADERAYRRNLAACLERHGIGLPATATFLARSLGVNHPAYWQPLEFEVDYDALCSRPREPFSNESLANRLLEDTRRKQHQRRVTH